MQIVEIKFGITKNIGNYESERFDATAIVKENDDPEACRLVLKNYVYGGSMTKSENGKAEGNTTSQSPSVDPIIAAAAATPAPKKEKKEKKEKAPTPESKVEAAPTPEQKEEEIEETAPVEEKAPVKEEVKAAPPKEAKTKPGSKDTPYSRTNDIHKKLFGEAAKEILGDWKSNAAHVNKVKAASMKLADTPMLTSEGMVSTEFKEKLKAELLA